jgi:replicative DNA helicase Mcm
MTDKSPTERKMLPTERFELFYQELIRDEVTKAFQEYPDKKSLLLDYNELDLFDQHLGDLLDEKPAEALKAATKELHKLNPFPPKKVSLTVRITNTKPSVRSLRFLKSARLHKLVTVDALVKKTTPIIPVIKNAMFECRSCMRLYDQKQDMSTGLKEPKEPAMCHECGGRSFRLLKEESDYEDFQVITVQESHEQISGKQQPRQMKVWILGDEVDTVAPGELVRITGILNSVRAKEKNSYEEFVIQGIHLEHLAKEYEEVKITPDDEIEIKELSRDPDLYEKIIDSTAPVISGFDLFKEAVALQLFGGTPVEVNNADIAIRSNIHILVVGDPGLGKSQILKLISKIAPGGIYTSGKGASGVGLTAALVSDDVGGWTLEAGALVLGDKGFVCIDEFDKMNKSDRSAIHEALEQGTVSVAKASIQATLNARCSVLAAANPKFGRFNRYKPIAEQLDLPAPLLSRFDLIFVSEDRPNREHDREVVRHIMDVRNTEKLEYAIDPLLLKKYIAYARQNFKPVLTKAAEDRLEKYYVNLRCAGAGDADMPMTITPRQFEGIIRLAGASAKVHLRNEINIADVERVIRLQEECMKQIGFDPESGQVDVDVVEGRTSQKQRNNFTKTSELIEKLEYELGYMPSEKQLLDHIEANIGVDREEARKLLNGVFKDES